MKKHLKDKHSRRGLLQMVMFLAKQLDSTSAVLPPLVLLWVPSYNRIEPSLAGIPFFYWYQMAWVIVTAGLTLIVYWIDRRRAP